MRAPLVTLSFSSALLLVVAAPALAERPPEPLPLTAGAKVVTLWPAGSPMLKATDAKEVFTMTEGQPTRVQKVVEVHNPSIELHLAPKGKANGIGIVLAPGGGNKELVVGTEGTDIATWLNDLGISAFILRYRLQTYSSATDALADSALQEHRAFPLLLDLADTLSRTTFGSTDFNQSVDLAYLESGQSAHYLTDHRPRH